MGFLITLIIFALLTVLSEVLKPKPKNENARPAGLGDFKFPTATEGRVVPLIWGTVKMEGPNVVWYGDLTQVAIKKKIKTGLFSSSKVTTGYKYYIGIQFAMSRGTVGEFRRLWIGEKEITMTPLTAPGSITISEPSLFGGNDLGNGGVSGKLSWLAGDFSQVANTYLDDFQQEGGDSPGYRGTSYFVFEKGYIGNSTSIKPWSFELRRLPDGPGTIGNKAVNSGADANPAYVLFEIMTNEEWGLGFPESDIDATAFNAVADTLRTEGNGFSFVLDQNREIDELLDEVQRQIDGIVFLDQRSGKWTLKLARDDFNPVTIPVLDDTNLIELKNFARGAWGDTTNFITVAFVDRSRDYFDTFALAQDMANFRTQGVYNKANVAMPGVKDKTLANSIAWRELRMLSFPLAKATVVVDREFWELNPTDVIKWTNAALGFTDLIMRVSRIDLGELSDGKIELSIIQDVFSTETPSFGDPPATGWVPPSNTLVAIPALQSVAMEAPRAFSIRDTDPESKDLPFRVWVSARNQGDGAVEIDVRTRTSGAFHTERTVDDFVLLGSLTSAITESKTTGVQDSTIEVTPLPDGQTVLFDSFESVGVNLLGQDLTQVILIDDEFMLVRSASINVSNIDMNSVQRGVLDSVPAVHAINATVWLIYVGGGIGNRSFVNGNAVDVRLVSRAPDSELSESSATNLVVNMNNRHLRPYPPLGLGVNGAAEYATGPHSLDANGSLDAAGLVGTFRRKDYLTFQENRAHLSGDIAPSNTTTKYRVRVFDATSLPATELFVTTYNAGVNTVQALRTRILRHTVGVIPTDIRLDIETEHTLDAITYTALQDLSFTFSVQSNQLTGDFNLGVLNNLAISNTWVVPTTGTYNFSIGTANTGGPIEARINGGSWATVIATSGTAGTLAGVTASDTLEVRANGLTLSGTAETILLIDSPSSATDAYAIFAP